MTEDDQRQSPGSCLPGQADDRQHVRSSAPVTPDNFTIFEGIFEGTSEIQRLIIGCAVTGLDVR